MDLRFEPDPAHTDGVFDALLFVNDKLLGNYVQDLPVHGNGHGLRRIDRAYDVQFGNLVVIAGNGHDALAVDRSDMVARDTDDHRLDVLAGHKFGLFDGLLDRADRFIDVDYDAFSQSVGKAHPDADDLELAVGVKL